MSHLITVVTLKAAPAFVCGVTMSSTDTAIRFTLTTVAINVTFLVALLTGFKFEAVVDVVSYVVTVGTHIIVDLVVGVLVVIVVVVLVVLIVMVVLVLIIFLFLFVIVCIIVWGDG